MFVRNLCKYTNHPRHYMSEAISLHHQHCKKFPKHGNFFSIQQCWEVLVLEHFVSCVLNLPLIILYQYILLYIL